MESRTKFYRDKVNGKWIGVCAGIADYTGVDPLLVRIGFVVATLGGAGILLPLYLITAWLTDGKPAAQYHDDPERAKFWSDVRVAPQRTVRDVHSRFRDLDRRLRDIEAHTVSSNTRLAAEIDNLR